MNYLKFYLKNTHINKKKSKWDSKPEGIIKNKAKINDTETKENRQTQYNEKLALWNES